MKVEPKQPEKSLAPPVSEVDGCVELVVYEVDDRLDLSDKRDASPEKKEQSGSKSGREWSGWLWLPALHAVTGGGEDGKDKGRNGEDGDNHEAIVERDHSTPAGEAVDVGAIGAEGE